MSTGLMKPGTKVSVTSGFFKGRVGKVSEKQEEKVSGIWVDISVVDGYPEHRLWFPSTEIERSL